MDDDPKFTIIKQGAEGRLFRGVYLQKSVIVKERFKKKYRHPDLDDFLTKERIRAEVRSVLRCKEAGIRTPAIYLVDLQRRCIFMEEIEGSITAKQFINNVNESESSKTDKEALERVIGEIGISLGKMHKNNIIHGDLTTSNILIKSEDQLYLIDFGLSSSSTSAEDKAVDLYVLERALLSTHSDSEHLFNIILKSYCKNHKGSKEVLDKLAEVRARGRKRTMIG